MKFSAKKKLIPAIAMLLVSIISLTTASYAWFSMNSTVTATGMSVNATADSSLVIKGDNDSAYTAIGTNALSVATMKPSTSFDGTNFGYLAAGNVVASAAASTVTWKDGAFDTSDLVKVDAAGTYYAEAKYSLKNVGAAAGAVYVGSITVSNDSADTNKDIYKSMRISVQLGTGTVYVYNPNAGTLAAEGVGKYSAEAPNWSLDTPTYSLYSQSIGALEADVAKDVTVKIWFEGQDTACFSDAVQTEALQIQMTFTTTQPA